MSIWLISALLWLNEYGPLIVAGVVIGALMVWAVRR